MRDIRFLEVVPGSEQYSALGKSVDALKNGGGSSKSENEKKIDGKGSGHLHRLAGLFHILHVASQDVATIGKGEPCNGLENLANFRRRAAGSQ